MPLPIQKYMDVVFLIDATGSMGATIRAAHDKATEMAVQIRVQSPDVHIIFGCVCYRDPVDSRQDVHQAHQLEEDIDAMVTFMASVHANGGGDGSDKVLHEIQWRDAAKAVVHIADAPAHGKRFCGMDNHNDQKALLPPFIEELAAKKIAVSCLNIGGGARLSYSEMKAIYDKAQDVHCTVADHSLNGADRLDQRLQKATHLRRKHVEDRALASQ
jgi:hypothetical protein